MDGATIEQGSPAADALVRQLCTDGPGDPGSDRCSVAHLLHLASITG